MAGTANHASAGSSGMSHPMWKFFICHAAEDKESVARPLAVALRSRGHEVWYDDWELRIGDGLRRCIDAGLLGSRYGIVILSPDFFRKGWPQWELDGLVQMEREGRKVLLPVWHKVRRRQVAAFSLPLADRVAGSTRHGIEPLAERLIAAAASDGAAQAAGSGPPAEASACREKRGEVMEALSDFRAIIESLCGGSRPTPDGWLRLAGDIAGARAEVCRRLDRNSPWLDPSWLVDVDRLVDLGLRITYNAQYGPAADGAGSAASGRAVASLCDEFRALFRAVRSSH